MRISISHRLYFILGIMVFLISAELTALWFTIHTLSAVRAYVGGEGLWSKAEKDAVYELETYGRTRDPRAYQAYLAFLRVPLGDQKARLEMAKASPDRQREIEGMLEGRNQLSDIPGMIALFRQFNRISYISDAISDWTKGDGLISQIQSFGFRLHDEVLAGRSNAVVDRTLDDVARVNQRLTAVEDHFSYTLGEGSRWLTDLVLKTLFGAAIAVELTGFFLTASVTRGLSKRLRAMLGAADRISKGDYAVSFETGSGDEVGRLSIALNRMTRDLESERDRAEHAVRTSEEALREAQRVAHVGSWEWDVQRDTVTCSKEFLRLSGASTDRMPYAGFIDLVHPSDRSSVDMTIDSARRSRQPFCIDYRAPSEEGERWLCAQGTVAYDPSTEHTRVLGTVFDVTERRHAEEHLEHLARHDSLTGLPNRELLMDRLGQAVARSKRNGRPGALLFLDLDNFKTLNDTLGHGVGDRLLVAVGERLKASLREDDTVARSGGDEFLVVLNDLSTQDAAGAVARTLGAGLARPFSVDGHELFVTVSIGISVFPDNGVDVESLIRDADTAMYQAKRLGRNKFQYYSPHMHEHVVKMLSLQGELRRALERSEFVVYYQPLVALQTCEIVAAEALVRWQHPTEGLRLPGEFIEAAEDNGLIVPIGDWVLREACRQCRRWRDRGFGDIRVTVNVSPLQLSQSDFPTTVTDALRQADLHPSALDLEITETAVMSEPGRAALVLGELRRIGVGILLDDFGTGYSSLNHLKRLPIDALKIDRSFVQDLVSDPFDKAIAESIIALSKAVGLRAIAEGIETGVQLDLLRALGCDEFQGFYFSAAVDASAFEELMRSRSRPGRIPLRIAEAGS